MAIQKWIEELSADEAQTRIDASDALCVATEKKEDLTAAIPALGGALGDAESKVRSNVAWLLATLAQGGAELGPILDDMGESLRADGGKIASNVAWAVRCTALKTDVSALAPTLTNLIGDKNASTNALKALTCAMDLEASRGATRAALKAGLADDRNRVAVESAVTLTHHFCGHNGGPEVIALLESDRGAVLFGALVGVGKAAKQGAAPPDGVLKAVGEHLGHDEVQVQRRAATTFIEAANSGHDTAAGLTALAAAAAAGDLSVRKEAIWALYCAARNGTDLGKALGPLEECLEDADGSVAGNAAIGVALHYLNAQRVDDASTLLERHPFGAAWAFADHACKSGQAESLKEIIRSIQGGLGARDQGVRRGIATAIDNASKLEPDGSRALAAVQEVLAELDPDDAVGYSAISGIFMALRQLQRR